MRLFSRFSSRTEGDDGDTKRIANPAIDQPLSLQVLFEQKPALDPAAISAALRSYHHSVAKARCEVDPASTNSTRCCHRADIVTCATNAPAVPPPAIGPIDSPGRWS